MKYLKKKSFLITALIFFTACLISGGLVYLNIKKDKQNASAASCGDNNIAGFAWSSNIGWVSFNKGDCINGVVCRNITTKEVNNYNCETTECLDNDGECADWCQVCDNDSKIICDDDSDCGAGSCVANNYGVKIDWPTGNFSGYAWSPNIGWVSFNRKTCNSGADNGEGCAQDSDCNGSVPCELTGPGATGVPPEAPYGTDDYIAKYDSGTDDVTGWAKALSLGNDGWIKLSDASWSNGVKINGTSKEFEGWAWNGNTTAGTGIGWISFNCLNTGTCDVSDYKVYIANTAPNAIDLKAPNITYEQACLSRDARRVQLRWDFDDPDEAACGDYESAYQIIVDTVNYTTQAQLEALIDNERLNGWPYKTPKTSVPSPPTPVESFFPTNNTIHRNAVLDYDEHYFWWVKVWDKYGADSGWVQYNSDLLTPPTDTDNDDSFNLTFWTYKHEFPEPYFNWFPLVPSKDEKTLFSDLGSKYYTYTGPQTNDVNTCPAEASSNCSYKWTGSDISIVITNDTASSTDITIGEAKINKTIDLKVTDIDGYYCSTSTTFMANIKLPTWKEVKYR